MKRLKMPAQSEQLQIVNAFIESNVSGALVPTMELAAEELLVNVFNYAYPPDSEGEAEVSIWEADFDGQRFSCFRVKDWGTPFNPFREAPVPDIMMSVEERPIGGLGIHLVRSMAAHYCYSHVDGANIVDLYFSFPEEESQ